MRSPNADATTRITTSPQRAPQRVWTTRRSWLNAFSIHCFFTVCVFVLVSPDGISTLNINIYHLLMRWERFGGQPKHPVTAVSGSSRRNRRIASFNHVWDPPPSCLLLGNLCFVMRLRRKEKKQGVPGGGGAGGGGGGGGLLAD